MKINYQIYVDGSCRANGNGGIGVVWIKNRKKVFEYSKSFKNTTNNQMELIAILYALTSIKSPIDSLEIVTDSEYCIGVITNSNWKPKKNIKLINIVKKAVSTKQQLVKEPIRWTHVKGHQKVCDTNAAYNNLCDKLATEASNIIL
jgi:ribonuclease HI